MYFYDTKIYFTRSMRDQCSVQIAFTFSLTVSFFIHPPPRFTVLDFDITLKNLKDSQLLPNDIWMCTCNNQYFLTVFFFSPDIIYCTNHYSYEFKIAEEKLMYSQLQVF